MKSNFRKVFSYILAALTVFNTAAALYASAEQAPEMPEMIFVESETPGEYGYISDRYVDENGNEITFEEPEELALNCYSLESSSLPTAFDAREEGLVTETKNQNSTNNCWIFSTISALESDSIAKGITEKETTDFSEAHLSWFASRSATDNENDPTYGDGKNIESPYLQGGNWRVATAALARRSGLANESDFPFYPGNISAMGNYDETDRYNTDSGVILESAQELTDTDEIKEWVKEHGNVSAAIYYSDEYYSGNNTAYYCNTEQITNHQINIIGWDDSYPASNFTEGAVPEGDGAWLCRNSWGPYWGEGGYFRVSYYDCTLSGFYGFTARSTEDYYKNYSYNGAEWNTAFIGSNTTAGAANVFIGNGYEKLTSVSTYTVNPDTFIRVEIYKNLPENYSSPCEGTLAATIEKNIDNSGFHTLYLDSALSIEPGEIFSIAVEYTHYSGQVSVPIERTSSSRTYHSDSGESYIMLNPSTSKWYESSKYGFQNAFIQATTECDHPQTVSTVTAEPTCNAEGTVSDICEQCGGVTGTKCISRAEHVYGEWSEFSHDSESENEISVRECINCGTTQNKSYATGNTVRIDDFLAMFFERFFEIFKAFGLK